MTPDHEVVVALDERWLELPLSAPDPEVAGEGLVAVLDGRGGTPLAPQAVALVARAWGELLGDLTRRGRQDPGSRLVAAYALLAPTDPLPAAVAELWAMRLPASSLDAVADEVVAPAQERFGDPLVDSVATANGPAVRLEQLLVRPESDGTRGVRSQLTHVWAGPVEDTWLLLSAAFGSPVDAELMRGAYDELAGSLTVRQLP